ncbi:probable protein urg3 [Cephalotrichum gorgonifer]|uniref:Probable protein urg3 n=1 Tax=Cephalotrichum gorgonifer TaxID=2041049 RepID=A0AAE8N6L6_9PEZI|nr:probable protein urg3 [Cephalotrichum gorgonifer]
MGLFHRKKPQKDAQPPVKPSLSNASLDSAASLGNRASGGSTNPSTPMSPFSPVNMPKIDMPRPPDPQLDPVGYLRSLGAVRERSSIVTEKALRNELRHFEVDMNKFPDVVTFVARIIKRDYDAPFTSIPAHGRHQHFCVGGRDRVAALLSTFPEDVDNSEKCRRMIDLYLISVLLDAGAGTEWSYKSRENNRVYRRSEGIAVASLELFKQGLFSGNPKNKFQVDKEGLRQITAEKLADGLQSGPGNVMSGIEGRTALLLRLAEALEEKKEYFGQNGRPGNMIEHLLSHPSTQATSMPIVPLPVLWNVLMDGLTSIWPASRTTINGVPLGDAWPCQSLPRPSPGLNDPALSPFPQTPQTSPALWESILPFHKLTQWLCYSLMHPMQSLLRIHFAGTEMLTGLPEYRNGGLFIDLGVLTLKDADLERGLANYSEHFRLSGAKGVEVAPMFQPSDDVVVEWRGVTVGFLDLLRTEVNKKLKNELNGNELSLPQLLEAGSWKGGREIAEVSRPNTKEPPILIDSDGTVF